MKNNQKAFTLVELIVVITILAILWTVAFLSLSEYSNLARNSIRLDGISKVATLVETKKQSGSKILSFVEWWQEVPGAQIAWRAAIAWVDYQAWDINTSALELKSEDFVDPTSGKIYKMWATLKKWWQYEVITTLEDNWVEVSKISGTYEQRDSEIISWIWVSWSKNFTLSDATDLNKLVKWDVVSWTGVVANSYIQKVSRDGLILSLSEEFTVDSDGIQLGSSESSGTVVSVDWVTPVTDGSSSIAYRVSSTPPPSFLGNSPDSFVTVWKTDNPGATGNNQIRIPVREYYGAEFTVDWWDGTTSEVTFSNDPDITHTYATPWTYTVSIDNIVASNFSMRTYPNDGDKLLEVQQWWDIQLASNWLQFNGAWNFIITATDEIDISNVTSLRQAFSNARNFTWDISYWDTSNVVDMAFAFYNADSFNWDITDWDTSSVENMHRMFHSAGVFNQDINTDGNKWDVSKVEDMELMFSQATEFNWNITDWDTSSVNTMADMFKSAYNFNQDINTDGNKWNVSGVSDMSSMFNLAINFDWNISEWDTSSVTWFWMASMFARASNFNQDISWWNIWWLSSTFYMFQNTREFNQDISWWDISWVTDMRSMFADADGFNQDISWWNVWHVELMNNMLWAVAIFDQDLSGWNVSSVTDITTATASQFSWWETSAGWINSEKPSF